MRQFLPVITIFCIILSTNVKSQDKVKFNNESEYLHDQEVRKLMEDERNLHLKPLEPEYIIRDLRHDHEGWMEETDQIPQTPQPLETNCSNSDLSLGTWKGWKGCYGMFASPCESQGMLLTGAHPLHKMIDAPGWIDGNTCGGLPTIYPPGQAHVARIGDTMYTTGIQKAASLKYTLTVGPDSYLFVYRYAVVLQSGGHPVNQQPDFKVTITDTLGNQLGDTCGYYYVAAPTNGPAPPGWNICGGNVYWREWTTVGMNLTPFLGQKIEIKFEVRGCTFNTHYGYAYLSAYCGFLELQTALCEGDTSATLTAPPGFGYLWSTVNGDTSVNGDTTMSITVPNPTTGSSYTCLLTAVNGCQVTIVTNLTYTQIFTGFTTSLNCASRPSSFIDTTWVNQNQVTAWRWFFGDPSSGAADSSNLQFPTHSFTAPGTYNVTLISYSTEGCSDTTTKQITIGPLPTAPTPANVITICSGQPVNYTLTANEPSAWFNWRAYPRVAGPITGFANNYTVNNPDTVIMDTLYNIGATADTVYYRIVPITSGCTGDSVTLKVVVKPYPDLITTPLLKSICDSTKTNIDLNAHNQGTTYTWTCTASSANLSGYSDNTTTPDTAINQLLRNNGYNIDTVTYHITGQGYGCTGPTYHFKVAVYPKPDLTNSPPTASTCNGVPISIPLTSNVAGTLFTWTVAQVGTAGGTNNAIPAGILNQTLTNAGPGIGTATYAMTPKANGCNGWVTNFVVTVSPTAIVVTNPAVLSICSGGTATITISSATPGTTYTWTATPSSPLVTGYANGSGNSISQVLSNTSNADQTVTYLITPTVNGCTGTQKSMVVTVKPLPDVLFNPAAPQICSGTQVTINLTSSVAGTTYSWTSSASSPSVTGHSGGAGSPIAQTLTTPNIQVETVTYTVTGTSNGCSGTTYPVTVTINPSPVLTTSPLTQTICSETAINIALTATYPAATFTWTSAVVTGNVTGHAPGSGSSISQTLTNTLSSAGVVRYTITPANGTCNGPAAQYNVTVNPKPLLSNSPATKEICNGAQTNVMLVSNVAGATFTWTATGSSANVTGFSDNAVPGTLLNQTLFNSGTVLETVTYHITPRANNCDGPVTDFVVTVHPVPVPTLAGNNFLCTGTTGVVYTTEAGRTSYVWNVSAGGTITAGGTSTSNTVTVTWNTPGAKTVSVSYSDPFGCPAAAPVVFPVTVNPLPVPTIAGSNSVCVGTTGVVYTTEAGKANYTWNISAGGTVTSGGTATDNTVTVTWTTVGAKTVSVNYLDANSCTAVSPTVYNVTVNPLPVPTITGNNSLCRLSSGIVYTTQAGRTNYSWTVSAGGTITAGGTATDNTVTVTWNASGPQSVSVNYFDANGCTALSPTVFNVTVHPLPVPAITGPAAICLNTDGTYSTESGKANYTWTVSAGGSIVSGSGTNSVVIHWNVLGPQTITVNYMDANGCYAENPTSYSVNVNTLPVPALSGLTGICEGLTTTYTTDAGMSSYTWNVSAGGTITAGGGASDNTVTVNWTSAGARSVSVNYNVATGCTGASPTVANVTVFPRPVPALAGSISVCEASTGNVYTTDAGKANYTWVVSAGGTITAGGTTSSNTVTVTWNTPGPQTVSVDYTDANNCNAYNPTVLNVTVHPLPVPTITGNIEFCAGTTGVVYTTQPGQNNYQWVVSPGGIITAGGTSTSSSVTVTWATPGAQFVTVNYVDGFGCTAPAPFNLAVIVNPLPIPVISGTTALCEGTTGVVYSTQPGHSNYIWNVSAGGTITAGGTPADNTVTVSWLTFGAKTVSVNFTDIEGCTAVSPTVYNVTVFPRPVPALTGTNAVCATTTNVVYTTDAGKTNYTWVVSAGGTITAGGTTSSNTVTVTWNTPGPQTVSVNYTDANNCNAYNPTVLNVTVHPLPVPTITGPASVCLNSNGTYTTEGGKANYSWTVSAGGVITSGSGTNSIIINWTTLGPQTVTVNYFDANGCTATLPTSYTVNVNLLPVPALAGQNSICTGFSATYTTDLGMNNYLWNVSAGGSITSGGTINDNTITVLWTTVGNQTVSVNYTMGTGCTAPAPTVYTVVVHPLPVPVIAGSNVLCAGPSSVVYSTQPGMTNYLWTVTGGTISAGGGVNDATVSVQWLTPGPKTVAVNYTDPNSCTALAPVVYPVTINPLPVPALAGPASICHNFTGNYSTDAGMTNYQWTVSPGGTITSGAGTNTISVLWTTTGVKTITVNYNDVNGCTAPAPSSFTVTVNPLPVPTITGTNSICTGLTAVYRTEKLMTNYIWTISPGGSIVAGGSLSDSTVTVLWSTFGANTVSVNYNIPVTGCTATTPTVYIVTVKQRPSVTNAVTASSICSGTANNYVLQADLPGTTFAWTASGSSPQVTGFSSASGPIISQTLLNSGNVPELVTYQVTPTLNGCDGSVTSFMTTVFPVAMVTFTPGTQSFCSGGTTGISLSSNVSGTSFTWTATPSSANINGFSNGGGPLIQQTLNNTSYLIENVTYNVSPLANNCPGTNNQVTVNVYPWPAVSFTACSEILTTTDGKPFTLKGGSPVGGTYSGTGVSGGVFNPAFAGTGSHVITYGYSNTWGCSGNATQTINVLSPVLFTCGGPLTDIRDNQQYPTVLIGTQCWMSTNLNYGTQILSSTMQRDNCVNEKYCYTDNPGTCTANGGLYQWDEVMRYDQAVSQQGVCPPGWHVPNENDWLSLFNYYTSNGFAGSALKYDGYSGFNAFLTGARFDNRVYDYAGFAIHYWSSTPHGPYKAWAHAMNIHNPSVSYYPGNRSDGFAVRCIKD